MDLITYRNAVAETVVSANHFPAGMENFKASSNNPTEYIKKVILLCIADRTKIWKYSRYAAPN